MTLSSYYLRLLYFLLLLEYLLNKCSAVELCDDREGGGRFRCQSSYHIHSALPTAVFGLVGHIMIGVV